MWTIIVPEQLQEACSILVGDANQKEGRCPTELVTNDLEAPSTNKRHYYLLYYV